MKISVVGCGYVGLITGVSFAETGNQVIGVDIDENKINLLNEGGSPIYEPGLPELLIKNLKEKKIYFTSNIKKAVEESEIIFIAVGTPSDHNGNSDLSALVGVAEDIGRYMNEKKIVVVKSTVPVGSTQMVSRTIRAALQTRKVEFPLALISNPEFLREGSALEDCLHPARIVIGSTDQDAKKVMQRLYAPFCPNGTDNIIFMDFASAELSKYAANAFLATKISFINEMSLLAEKVGADIENLRLGIGSDPRIGSQFLFAGLGYGGPCLPKDIRSLLKIGQDCGQDLSVVRAVESANGKQRKAFVAKVTGHFGDRLEGRRLAVWGVSFKPGTDDLREAPSLEILDSLLKKGAGLHCFDPIALHNAQKKISGHVQFFDDPYQALRGCDALLILTEWELFHQPDFTRMKQNLRTPLIFDGRNIYHPQRLKALGFDYRCMGRPQQGTRE